MYKIFIDTNIFLDFYRVNNRDSLIELSDEIVRYKRYLIGTEQSNDEFFRNRERIINEFIMILNKQINSLYDNNFISTLDCYREYSDDIKKANASIKKMMDTCKILIDEIDKDPVYRLYLNVTSKMYSRTDLIIDKAIKRKQIGNPPTSTKNTCCDEIIWETLITNCKDDLIIVSRDNTFKDNYSFLRNEYNKKTGKKLVVVELISDAIRYNGQVPSEKFENIENDLIIERDILEYGMLQEKSNWVNITYNSLLRLGGEATLKELYNEIYRVVETKYPEKINNNDIEATIRGILQRYCSESTNYNQKFDLFKQIERGRWSIRNINSQSNMEGL